MKKTKKAVLAAIACSAVLAGALGLAACGGDNGGNSGHTHVYEEGWTYSSENVARGHWHKCEVAGCSEISGLTAHTWTDNDWVDDTENTANEKRECPDCHAIETRVKPIPHEHSWGNWEVTTENAPDETHGGKATRTCYGAGDCDATSELKELTLPALNETDYEVQERSTVSCNMDGETVYIYTVSEKEVGEGDNKYVMKETVEVKVTTPADPSLHDWDETTWHFDDETGHYHTCKNNGCEGEKSDHDENGEHVTGECSVCGYLPPVEWNVECDETTSQDTLEGVYVATVNRVLKLKGLTSGNDYTLSTNNSNVVLGSGGQGSNGKTITFTYFEVEEGEGMPINVISESGAHENVTITIEDKGEHIVPFEGASLTVAQMTAFTNYGWDPTIYEVVIEEDGNYVISLGGVEESAVEIYLGTRLVETFGGGYEVNKDRLIEAVGGKYTLAAGTYYLSVMAKEEVGTVVGNIAIAKEGQDVKDSLELLVGVDKTFATLDETGVSLTFADAEAGLYYKLSCDNGNVKFVFDTDQGNPITFEYGGAYRRVTVVSTAGELTDVVIKLEQVEAPAAEYDSIALNQDVEANNGDVYAIELEAGKQYQVLVDGVAMDIDDYLSDVAISKRDPSDYAECILSVNKVVTVDANGTYYVMSYADVTIKIVEKAAD